MENERKIENSPTSQGMFDQHPINVNDPVDINYWIHTLHCGVDDLKTVVQKVGTDPNKVVQYFRDKRRTH
jgi:hypothetical protein